MYNPAQYGWRKVAQKYPENNCEHIDTDHMFSILLALSYLLNHSQVEPLKENWICYQQNHRNQADS